MLNSLEKEGGQLAKRFYDASTLRIRQCRPEAAAVLQAPRSNLLPQDEEESEIFPTASQKEVDQCITRMLLRMGGEQVGDAVTESGEEEDAEQSAAELTAAAAATRDGDGGEKSCAWRTGTGGKTPAYKGS